MKKTTLSLCIALCLSCSPSAQAIDRIELNNGEVYQGRLNGMTAGYVILSQTSGAGAIERRYAPGQVKKLHFSDTDIEAEAHKLRKAKQFEQASGLYEGLIWQRLPYLGILGEDDEQLFVDLIHCYLATGRTLEASERIRLWKPRLKSPSIAERLEESAMLAAWRSGNQAEAVLLAQRWIDEGKPATTTCLAWRVIAQTHWQNGETKKTLWASLQPIVFSPMTPPRQLEYCYALAILAAHRLDDTFHADQLAAEMKDRDLAWPIELPTRSESVPLDPTTSPQFSSPDSTDSNAIHLDHLSKLIGKP